MFNSITGFSCIPDPHEEDIRQLMARVEELEQALKDRQTDSDLLEALRAAGVNNWEGYEMVMENFHN